MIENWKIDLASLYGELPREYRREEIFESPGGEYAVVLYAIDEVGVMKEAGRVAVFRKQATPELVFQPLDVLFWYSHAATVDFEPTGRFATLWEFRDQMKSGDWPPPRRRTIDLEHGCFVSMEGAAPEGEATPKGEAAPNPLDRLVQAIAALVGLALPVLLVAMRRTAFESPLGLPGRGALVMTLRGGLLATAPLVVVSALVLRALRRRLNNWRASLFLLAFFELVVGPFAYAWLDVALDHADPQIYSVTVLGKREDSALNGEGGSSPSYELIVQSWRAPGTQTVIDVNESLFRAAVPNATQLTVRVRPGFFGHSWLERPVAGDMSPRR